ncbi:MAG: MFS transporter [Thermomicrobiales bacterium]
MASPRAVVNPRRLLPVAAMGQSFPALWGGSTASNLADGIFQVTLPLLAVSLTGSPASVAGVTFALTLPWLVFALLAGALVDRLDRRQTMVAANLLRAAAIGVLVVAVALDVVTLPVVYLAAFALGAAETFADTAAQAILPSVVAGVQLEGANARLLGAQTVANGFIGPPLGGALAGIGIALAMGTSAALYLVAAGTLLLLRGAFRPAQTVERRLRAEIGEGLRFLWGHALLRTLALIVFVMNLGWAAWMSVLVLYAVAPGPMGLSSFGYGLLLTAIGIGGVIGTIVAVPAMRLLGRRWAIGVDILGTIAMVGMPALTANPWLVGAAAVVGGVGATMWGVVVTSVRQQAVPDALLGRVSSAFRLCGFGAFAIGSLLAGGIAEVAGLRAVFAVCGGLSLFLFLPFFAVVTDQALAAGRQTSPGRAGRGEVG